MDESVGERARRVLVVGVGAGDKPLPIDDVVLPPDGTLIVMERDAARAADLRRRFSAEGIDGRATVICGDPRRILYKLAGPFDVIYADPAYLEVRPLLEKLLAPHGVLVTNVDV